MATGPLALWNGAISCGLVHIPVALYPATSENGIDFDWLDKRSIARKAAVPSTRKRHVA